MVVLVANDGMTFKLVQVKKGMLWFIGIAGSLVVSGTLQVWFHLLHFSLFYFLAKPHAGS